MNEQVEKIRSLELEVSNLKAELLEREELLSRIKSLLLGGANFVSELDALLGGRGFALTREDDSRQEKVQLEISDGQIAKLARGVEDSLSSLEGRLLGAIRSGAANSVKQIEAYLSLQDFLHSGEKGLDFHGWPISSDIAKFLLEKIDEEKYDLVIEFGSGTSTVIFGRAMKILYGSGPEKVAESALGEAAHGRPLKKVVSFEHHSQYFEKSKRRVQLEGLEGVVDLVRAPLVDIEVGSQSYRYYDCDERLSQISGQLDGEPAKILVLVDGPPASTGRHARLPAMEKVINHFSFCEVHVVLDDYNRVDEKEVVDSWMEILASRSIPVKGEELKFEKGAFAIYINV